MKHFERQLPEGYREVFTVDATAKRFAILMNLGAGIVTLAVFALYILCVRPALHFAALSPLTPLVFSAVLLGYIVAHELVHGLAYWLLTREKLRFGMTASCAYCGVPDIYVYRTASLIALLAPFTVFTLVFLAAAIAFQSPWNETLAVLALAIHLGGCIGDLYDSFLYLTRFRDPMTLMRDTGPKQCFYQRCE